MTENGTEYFHVQIMETNERIWMDQNFNCLFSDWIKRTKYKQGRCGRKPENSPPFIYHHKSLLKKKKGFILHETFEWIKNLCKNYMFSFSSLHLELYLTAVRSTAFLYSYLELWCWLFTFWRKAALSKFIIAWEEEAIMGMNMKSK